MSVPQRVELELAPVAGRPSYYRATDAAGRVVAQASRQPLLDAARALAATGMPPDTVVTARHRGSAIAAMRATLAEATPWTIEEPDRGGLRMRRWEPFQGADAFRDGAAENAQVPTRPQGGAAIHLPTAHDCGRRPAPVIRAGGPDLMSGGMDHDVGSSAPSLLIATPTHDGRLHHGYGDALLATRALLCAHRVVNEHLFLPGWSLMPEARNEIAARFLDDPSWSHLLMVDSDIVWRPADVLRLLRHRLELVCGVYARKSAADPALLFWRVDAGTGPLPRCARTGCLEIAATGAGFMLERKPI